MKRATPEDQHGVPTKTASPPSQTGPEGRTPDDAHARESRTQAGPLDPTLANMRPGIAPLAFWRFVHYFVAIVFGLLCIIFSVLKPTVSVRSFQFTLFLHTHQHQQTLLEILPKFMTLFV